MSEKFSWANPLTCAAVVRSVRARGHTKLQRAAAAVVVGRMKSFLKKTK